MPGASWKSSAGVRGRRSRDPDGRRHARRGPARGTVRRRCLSSTAGRAGRDLPDLGVRARDRRRGAGAFAHGVADGDAPVPGEVDDDRRGRRPDWRHSGSFLVAEVLGPSLSGTAGGWLPPTVNYGTPAEIMTSRPTCSPRSTRAPSRRRSVRDSGTVPWRRRVGEPRRSPRWAVMQAAALAARASRRDYGRDQLRTGGVAELAAPRRCRAARRSASGCGGGVGGAGRRGSGRGGGARVRRARPGPPGRGADGPAGQGPGVRLRPGRRSRA